MAGVTAKVLKKVTDLLPAGGATSWIIWRRANQQHKNNKIKSNNNNLI